MSERPNGERTSDVAADALEAAASGARESAATGVRPQPAPGPGEAITPSQLRERWSSIEGRVSVVGFYGHSISKGDIRCFSNFYDQTAEPFDFEVPACFRVKLGSSVPWVVPCEFSEKAIMLCKAAVMGDAETYLKLVACRENRKIKSLGREVTPFVSETWNSVVCSVAFEAVHQKFAKTPSLQGVLLQTGEKLIAEATKDDANWGIGIDEGDPRAETPAAWEGSNVLGWALMEARAALRRARKLNASEDGEAKAAGSDAEPEEKLRAERT